MFAPVTPLAPFDLDAQAIALVVPAEDEPRAEAARESVSAQAEPVVSGVAAALSLVATRLAAGTIEARAVATVGNVLWSASGAWREHGNGLRSTTLSAANLMTVAAGATNIAPAFRSNAALGYASAASWAASGGLRVAHAAAPEAGRAVASRMLEGASGVTTIAAAAISAAATGLATSDPLRAGVLATASPVVWMVSDALQYAAVTRPRVPPTRSAPPADPPPTAV